MVYFPWHTAFRGHSKNAINISLGENLRLCEKIKRYPVVIVSLKKKKKEFFDQLIRDVPMFSTCYTHDLELLIFHILRAFFAMPRDHLR